MHRAAAARASTTKSRSLAASSELAVTPPRPSWGDRVAIDRESGTGEGARAERRAVGPRPGVAEAPAVTLEHLDVGEEVVGEQDRLGGLDVGHAGHDGIAVALGALDEARSRSSNASSMTASVRRSQSRRSSATWSLRDRPVCSFPATARCAPERRLEVEVDVLQVASQAKAAAGRPRRGRPARPPARPPRRGSGARPGPGRGSNGRPSRPGRRAPARGRPRSSA